MSGVIYCGDNIDILREYVPPASIDLVYLDPPFNSQRTYNMVHKDSEALKEAFKDCWSWEEAAPTFAALLESTDIPKALKQILRALKEHELARRDKTKLEFERWVLQRVGAAKQRKHDRGIDGESLYKDGARNYHVLVSVKGGAVNPAMMRDLVGTVHRVKADIGVMVTLKEPSAEMRREAVEAGYLSVSDDAGKIPRIQIVTIEQLFKRSANRPFRVPGETKTVMPKKSVPPTSGTQLSLDMTENDNGTRKSGRIQGLRKATPPEKEKKAVHTRKKSRSAG